MTLNLVDAELELSALVAMVKATDDMVKLRLYGNLKPDYFEYAHDSFVRLKQLALNGLPSLATIMQDWVITQDIKSYINQANCLVKTKEDADNLIENIKVFYKRRFYAELGADLAEGLRKSSAGDINALDDLDRKIGEAHLLVKEVQPENCVLIGKGADPKSLRYPITLYTSEETIFPTGVPIFDTINGGWRGGQLGIIAAKRGGGKSTMALSLGIRQYSQYNLNIAFISLEMPQKEVVAKVISDISDIPFIDIIKTMDARKRHDVDPDVKRHAYEIWQEFQRHGVENNCRFAIFNFSTITTEDLAVLIKPFAFNIVYVDYINLMSSGKGNTVWENMYNISKKLKQVALQTKTNIVALAQLNEDSRVKYSRGLEEDSDWFWLWDVDDEELKITHRIEVRVEKCRTGRTMTFPMKAEFNKSRIIPITDENRDDVITNEESNYSDVPF